MSKRSPKKSKITLQFHHYLAIVILLNIIIAFPIPHNASKEITLRYKEQHIQDASLELGDKQTRQAGVNGQGLERKHEIKPLFALLLGLNIKYSTSKLPTQTTQAPINQVVADGTKKYQYMWCSNGGYSYYSNEQFKNPKVGFTHKSVDDCAKKNYGHMTGLADTAPPQQTTRNVYTPSYTPRYTPTYTTCHEYSYLNSFSCTTY